MHATTWDTQFTASLREHRPLPRMAQYESQTRGVQSVVGLSRVVTGFTGWVRVRALPTSPELQLALREMHVVCPAVGWICPGGHCWQGSPALKLPFDPGAQGWHVPRPPVLNSPPWPTEASLQGSWADWPTLRQVYPGSQALHSPLPSTSAYLPRGQGLHRGVPGAEANEPRGHWVQFPG